MQMEMQALPGWVDLVARVFVGLAILAAIAVVYDIYGRGYRQRVRSMEAVWALSALWLGPLALPLYARTGRPRSDKWQAEHPSSGEPGLTAAAASGGLPGGAASLVGHVIGVPHRRGRRLAPVRRRHVRDDRGHRRPGDRDAVRV